MTGLMRRGGRALLVHRAPGRRWYPDCWDLPGGHVEDGETQAEALRRELGEELGVTATVAGPAYTAFSGATFHFTRATFCGATVDFTDATFSGGRAALAAGIAANPPAGLLLPSA